MKRRKPLRSDPSKPLRRARPLRAGAPGLKRSRPLRSTPAVRRKLDREASEAWARAARGSRCAVCGAKGAQGHHVVYQQQLRRVAGELGLEFERLRWDRRNLLPLCERHHSAHHSGARRVALDAVVALAPKVQQFARELGLEWWLERTYPAAGSSGGSEEED